ncbi:MAG: sulfatase [Armatimonadota bacterium]|nr:sulfatase [Armatimonadota bacterium]
MLRFNHLTRREFLAMIGAGSTALAVGDCPGFAGNAPNQNDRPPNVVLIFADDLGYGELSCQGSKDIPTPHIDSIAKNGVRFTNGYVTCPLCSPSRAGLMTGRYQERFGHETNPGGSEQVRYRHGLPITEKNLAERLKAAGYATGLVGKWHLGFTGNLVPWKRGFDEFFGFLGGVHHYIYDPDKTSGIMRGSKFIQEKEYLTDAFGREAVSFIDRHKSEPIFLYLAYNAVHNIQEATEKYLKRFESIKDEKRRVFAGMLSGMDDAVGATLRALHDNKLEDNTIVFFISDNGGPTHVTTSNNGPLRGVKAQLHEGGIRVPYMMQWKDHIPEGKAYEKPVVSMDVVPTVLAAAGLKANDTQLDGVNLIPYLKGKSSKPPHDTLYWRFDGNLAIRDGDLKLVNTLKYGEELFDLSKDIGEQNNLAAQNPEKLAELRQKLSKWDKDLPRTMWGLPVAPPRKQKQP